MGMSYLVILPVFNHLLPARSQQRKSPFMEPNGWKQLYSEAGSRNITYDINTGLLPSHWAKIVQIYSRLHLTRETDKLPALSGIAKREQSRRSGDEYLAGLWRRYRRL